MLTKRSSVFLHPFWIVLFTILAYSNTLGHSFLLWDDNWLVYQNRWVTSGSFTSLWYIFHPGVDRAELGSEYLPIPQFFYWIQYFFWDTNPVGYHLTQILLYGINSLLLYFWLSHLTSRRVAFFSALFFAFHPIHTESVAWISGQKDLWALFFFLLTCLAHEKKYFKVAQMTLLFAFLSKGTTIVLFGCLFLSDAFQKRSFAKHWKPYVGYIFFTFFFLVFHWWIAKHHGNIQEMTPSFQETLSQFGVSAVLYFKQLCLPSPLLAHYELRPFPLHLGIGLILFFVGGTLLYSLSCLVKRSLTPVSFFWLWFWGTLLPVSNLIFHRTSAFFAERYLLFPSIAFCFVFAFILVTYLPRLPWLVLFCFFLLTLDRNQEWQNTERLWKHNLTISPKNATVWGNLGMYYQELLQQEKDISLAKRYWRQAELCYKECLKFQPQHIRSIHNLGLMELDKIRLTSDLTQKTQHLQNAQNFFMQALKINPLMTQALSSLGGIAVQQGNFQTAKQYYLQALEEEPFHFVSLVGLGNVFLAEKNYPQSERFYQKAFEDRPQEWILKHYCFGLLYVEWSQQVPYYRKFAEEHLLKIQKIHPKAEQELKKIKNAK